MANGRCLVSVIITTYQRNSLLQRAIEGILSQSYEPIEIIVVDDSGTRHAESVVEGYDVRYIPHDENKGQPAAWYTGFRESNGTYIQFHDDDDKLKPEKIARQVSLLKREEDIGAVYCGLITGYLEGGTWVKTDTYLPDEKNRGNILRSLLAFDVYPLVTTTLLIERDYIEQALPMPDYYACRDIALCLEFAESTNFDFVNDALVYKRIGADSRWYQFGAMDGREHVIRNNKDRYDQFDPILYRNALANTHFIRGNRILNNHWWSMRAIIEFSQAVYVTRGQNLKFILMLGASLIGRPGRTIARYIATK